MIQRFRKLLILYMKYEPKSIMENFLLEGNTYADTAPISIYAMMISIFSDEFLMMNY